jgi:hypothetical protein
MLRATSVLGGNPIVLDLRALSSLKASVPAYPPLVRDVETVERNLRRKNFGTRPTAELTFETRHSRDLNLSARYEVVGDPLVANRLNLDSSPWSLFSATIARSVERDPQGLMGAWVLDESSAPSVGRLQISALAGKAQVLLSAYVRSDPRHGMSLRLSGGATVAGNFNAMPTWRKHSILLDQSATPGTSIAVWITVFVTTDTTSLGTLEVFAPEILEVVSLPGTDEEILTDAYDKLCSDDWTVELTMDGGLTWRVVLLQDYEKSPVEDKWIGHFVRFALECSDKIEHRPAALDGRW